MGQLGHFSVVPSSDKAYVDAANRVGTDLKLSVVHVQLGDVQLHDGKLVPDEAIQAVLDSNGRVFEELVFQFVDGNGPYIKVERARDSSDRHSYFDTVKLSYGGLAAVTAARFASAAQQHFGTSRIDFIGNLLGPEAQAQFKAREIALSRLETLAAPPRLPLLSGSPPNGRASTIRVIQ